MREPNFMGLDGFIWFQGVVEDRQDPKKLGRVRVRILGSHVASKQLIPTEDLPWAYIMQPITSAAMNGIGEAPIGPVPGTWVVGFFRDGENRQEPVIMGTVGGIPEQPANTSVGFFDPRDNPNLTEKLASAPRKIQKRSYPKDGSGAQLTNEPTAKNYPRTVNPLGATIGEPDTNRLARNENVDDTLIGEQNANLDTSVPEAFSGTWSEPTSPYQASYPYNQVKESESGHQEEFDDTPNHERIRQSHRSMTFYEIGPDGSRVEKIVKDNYTIILKDDYVHIMGIENRTVQHDSNQLYQKNLNVEIDGNYNLLVKGSAYIQVQGDVDITSGGSVNIKAVGDINMDATTINLNSGAANPLTPKQG